MARVFQTGFEFPGTGTLATSGTYIGHQYISAGYVPSLGLPIASSGNNVNKVPEGYTGTHTSHKSITGLGGSSFLALYGAGTVTSLSSFSVPI